MSGMRDKEGRKHKNQPVWGCQERSVMWIKMERPRASLHFCLVKGQSGGGVSPVCACAFEGALSVFIRVSVERTPGSLERLLLTDLMPLLDTRHVADTLPQARMCPSKCRECVHLLSAHRYVCVSPPLSALRELVLIPTPEVSSLCLAGFCRRRAPSRCPQDL